MFMFKNILWLILKYLLLNAYMIFMLQDRCSTLRVAAVYPSELSEVQYLKQDVKNKRVLIIKVELKWGRS